MRRHEHNLGHNLGPNLLGDPMGPRAVRRAVTPHKVLLGEHVPRRIEPQVGREALEEDFEDARVHGRVQRGKLLAEPHVRPDELDFGVPIHDRVRHVNVHDLSEVGLGVVVLVEEAGVEAAFTPQRERTQRQAEGKQKALRGSEGKEKALRGTQRQSEASRRQAEGKQKALRGSQRQAEGKHSQAERRLPPSMVALRDTLFLIGRLTLERGDAIARAGQEVVRVAPHVRVERRRGDLLAVGLLRTCDEGKGRRGERVHARQGRISSRWAASDR